MLAAVSPATRRIQLKPPGKKRNLYTQGVLSASHIETPHSPPVGGRAAAAVPRRSCIPSRRPDLVRALMSENQQSHDEPSKEGVDAKEEAKTHLRKPLLKLLGFTAATALAAIVTWAVDSAISQATKTSPVAVSVQINDSQLPGFDDAPVSAIIPMIGKAEPVGPVSCPAFFQEIKRGAAVPSPLLLQLVVQSNTSQAVLIDNMTVKVVGRRPPVRGPLLKCTSQGVAQFRSINLNLDTPTRGAVYSVGKRYAPFGFTLQQGETEIFDVTATTTRSYVAFDIDLSVIAGGKPRSITVTDDGRPFEVSASPAEAWTWGDTDGWLSNSNKHAVGAGQRFPAGS